MILSEIRNYLKAKGGASAAEIAQDLDEEKSMVQAGIDHWIDQGRVEEVKEVCTCKNCSGCSGGSIASNFQVKIYRWVG